MSTDFLLLRSYVPSELCDLALDNLMYASGEVDDQGEHITDYELPLELARYVDASALSVLVNHWQASNLEYAIQSEEYTRMSPGQRLSRTLGSDIVAVIFLNAWSFIENQHRTFTGGEVVFPTVYNEHGYPLTIMPRVGDLLLYPSWNATMVSEVSTGTRHTLKYTLRG